MIATTAAAATTRTTLMMMIMIVIIIITLCGCIMASCCNVCDTAEGLQIVPVVSYEDIEKRMEEGTTNRTVAATNMNATSRLVDS